MKNLNLKYYLRNVISIKTEILPNERIIKYEGNLKGTMIGYLTCDCEPLAPLKPIKKNEFNAFALMEKFGWKKSMGLGKDLRGNPNPITIIEKKSFDPNYASEENDTDDDEKQPSFKWVSCNNRPVKIVNFVKGKNLDN